MARAIAAGQLGVAREAEAVADQGGSWGNEAAEASEDRSGEAEREDPDTRLARAVAERMAEKGKAAEKPSGWEYAAAENDVSQDVPAAENDVSQDVPASENDVSQDVPAGENAAARPDLWEYAGPEDEVAEEMPESENAAAPPVLSEPGGEASMYEPYSGERYSGEPYSGERYSGERYSASPPQASESQPGGGRSGWRARGKRVLNALGAPFRAFGAAIKSAFKGRKGKGQGAAPTAAELVGDPAAQAAPQAASGVLSPDELALEVPSGYWSYAQHNAWKAARQARPHPLAGGASAPAPAATKYGDLAQMRADHVNEHLSSTNFINDVLLPRRALADDMHRAGLIQSGEKASFQKDPASVREGLKRVWGWTDEEVRKYYDASSNKAKDTKVDYITSEQDLKKFVVRAGSTLQYGDPPQPFDTSGMLSKASGPGFAIFVMDAEGNIYAGQHRVGLFHHSSFLAGRPVAAAGEMKVSGGTLVELTGKSGHYAPSDDQMHQMLRELAGAGVALAGVRIKLWTETDAGFITKFYDAAEFLANKRGATSIGEGAVF